MVVEALVEEVEEEQVVIYWRADATEKESGEVDKELKVWWWRREDGGVERQVLLMVEE